MGYAILILVMLTILLSLIYIYNWTARPENFPPGDYNYFLVGFPSLSIIEVSGKKNYASRPSMVFTIRRQHTDVKKACGKM